MDDLGFGWQVIWLIALSGVAMGVAAGPAFGFAMLFTLFAIGTMVEQLVKRIEGHDE